MADLVKNENRIRPFNIRIIYVFPDEENLDVISVWSCHLPEVGETVKFDALSIREKRFQDRSRWTVSSRIFCVWCRPESGTPYSTRPNSMSKSILQNNNCMKCNGSGWYDVGGAHRFPGETIHMCDCRDTAKSDQCGSFSFRYKEIPNSALGYFVHGVTEALEKATNKIVFRSELVNGTLTIYLRERRPDDGD